MTEKMTRLNIDDERIRQLAAKFRGAIQSHRFTVRDAPALMDFPKGSCGDASILLGEFFAREGEGDWQYVAGKRQKDGHTHAWIEKEDLIVDITSDQFGKDREPVVVTRDRSWYRQFEVDPGMSHAARIDIYTDGYAKNMLKKAYKTVEESL